MILYGKVLVLFVLVFVLGFVDEGSRPEFVVFVLFVFYLQKTTSYSV